MRKRVHELMCQGCSFDQANKQATEEEAHAAAKKAKPKRKRKTAAKPKPKPVKQKAD